MRLPKLVYAIAEAGTHWYATYHAYHLNKLNIEISIYDSYFLVTKNQEIEQIARVRIFELDGMQVNGSLMLCNRQLARLEDEEL